MSEVQALVLDLLVGMVVSVGSVVLLDSLGANDQVQFIAAMLGLVGTCFMVGVISYLYEPAREQHREDRRP